MATTQLFAELLVIGIGAAVWLSLLLGAVFKYPVQQGLPALDAGRLVALAGASYVLGIIVDRMAYEVFRNTEKRLAASVLGAGEFPPVSILEREIFFASEILGSQIQYNRSRLRICRAWSFNAAVIAVSFVLWNIRAHAVGIWESSAVIAAAILMSAASTWAARTLARDHYTNLKESFEFIKSRRASPASEG